MIEHVRAANKKLKKRCKVAMDLGGPKIRTGPMRPGPEVLKIIPERDERGTVIDPARIWIGPLPLAVDPAPHLPVSQDALARLVQFERLYLTDLRGKPRILEIAERREDGCWATCNSTAYVESGQPMRMGEEPDAEAIEIGILPALEESILLRPGDTLWLYRDGKPGEPAVFENGRLVADAHISCTAGEVFDDVGIADPVLFDDGKIEGEIKEVQDDVLRIEILHAKAGQSKLKADKGINFPDSKLRLAGLTQKDRKDLEFVAQHADVVNLSFVNEASDVRDLYKELARLGALDRLGVILKIETKRGFDNLTEILMTGMQVHPMGIMIARGDLAVECGWENIARVQQEIMSLCQAAHVPDIWATQVLENLTKKGLPSRAEITDAATAQRAECVMLNKGPQILQAIHLLDEILKDMRHYQEKNAPMLPAMRKAG
jgi:pyruvate kinase